MRTTSEADERFCVRQATKNAVKDASKILKLLESNAGVTASPETVRRALRRGELGAIIRPKKPMLSPANIKKRLEWCHLRKDWTSDDWRRVIWSDETKRPRLIDLIQMVEAGFGFETARA